MAGRIVVGVDGSPAAARALAFALEEARRRDARVDAVLAYQQPVAYAGFEGAMVPPVPHAKVEQGARSELDEALGTVPQDVRVERIVAEGPSAAVLLDAARGADLLVVGSRGRGGFMGLLLGSTSHQVITHAPCPVVVVPCPEYSL